MPFKRAPTFGTGQCQVPFIGPFLFRPPQRCQAGLDILLQTTQAHAFAFDPRP
jgi:hypothetical protein